MSRNSIIYWNFENPGNLQSGFRPAYIVKETEHYLLLAPITSKQKKTKQPTHAIINDLHGTPAMILTEQLFWVKKPENIKKHIPVTSWSKRRMMEALKVSLGITKPSTIQTNESLDYYRGQIFRKGNRDFVVVQNNVGNRYAPTTIMAGLENGHIDSLFTVNSYDLKEYTHVGRKRKLTEEIQEFIG